MQQTNNNTLVQVPIGDFFGWKYHPFADTYKQHQLWIPPRDRKQLETIKRLLHTGKSMALCGPSGAGKTTLVHALIDELDKNSYRPVMVPYAGHPRNGLTRILAETLGVDTKGRGVPMITRVQQHLEALITGPNPRHPVIIIDDAQLLENESLWDLCSLLFQTVKQTVAASLILVGDETLAKRLELYALMPVKTRLTAVMKLQPMNEQETQLFIQNRLKNGAAPADLFADEAIDILAAYTSGNRRSIMNVATMALEEAYYRQEKTITAETLYEAEWFNESG
ncbi:AAA family ATPase [Desulfobulbus rhabdoformis]|jgi:type II secretory pathway predicted ATPase ExeA|uniref:ExeA family protein n=1 Tax=Desulfobulbus rhabdoformis TaxID=34032 RepID=UPI0019648F78|nr:AAA family ATPase [Desulfobulbus rhabdoformis]MBM9617023.1 AAA family ATPase [Desulfobulbus rhabdoformis]